MIQQYKNAFLYLTVCMLCAFTYQLKAQTTSIYFMDEIWQKNSVNPAHGSLNEQITISLPTFASGLLHSGPSLSYLFSVNTDNTLLVTPKAWLNQMDNEYNTFDSQLDIQTFALAIRTGNIIWNFGHSIRSSIDIGYSRSLIDYISNGNANQLNESIDLGHDLNLNVYGKWQLGMTRIGNVIDWGININLLNGIQHLSTPKSKISLLTQDEIYQLRLNADYKVLSAGNIDLNGLNNSNIGGLPKFNDFFTSNLGYSFDVGFLWHPTKKFSFGGALRDLGQIKWTQNTATYEVNGDYAFEGVDVFNSTLDSFIVSELRDSIFELVDVQIDTTSSFRTSLAWNFHLEWKYQLNEKIRIRGLFTNRKGIHSLKRYSLGLNYQILKSWNTGINYTFVSGRHQIGLNSSFRWKAFQLFAATDNLLGLGDIKNSLNTAFLVGGNLYF